MDILPDSINNIAVTRTVIIIPIKMISIAEKTVQTGHRIMKKLSGISYSNEKSNLR